MIGMKMLKDFINCAMKIKSRFATLIGHPSSVFEKFHDKTKISPQNGFNLKIFYKNRAINPFYKSYSRFPEIMLPDHPSNPFDRKNTSSYNSKVTKSKIGALIGQTYRMSLKNRILSPYEIYLISIKTDLEEGIYHYYPNNHSLESLSFLKKNSFLKYFIRSFKSKPNLLLLLTLHLNAFKSATREREYKNALLDIGVISGYLSIISESIQLDAITCNDYYDDEWNKTFGFDSLKEAVIQIIALYQK